MKLFHNNIIITIYYGNYQKNEENEKDIGEKEVWCNFWLCPHHGWKIKISQNNSQ